MSGLQAPKGAFHVFGSRHAGFTLEIPSEIRVAFLNTDSG
jgi:hypothetical protein